MAFALLVPLGVVAGTYPFLLGLAIALGRPAAPWPPGGRALALVAVVATALAHPLALAFLLVVLVAVAVSTRGWWRSRGNVALALGAALVAVGQGVLLRGFTTDGADYPFDPKDALAIAGVLRRGPAADARAFPTSARCGRSSWATRSSARWRSPSRRRSAATRSACCC